MINAMGNRNLGARWLHKKTRIDNPVDKEDSK